MSVATLHKVNQGLGSLAKKIPNPTYYGGGITVSAIKEIIVLTTNKQSVKHSETILKDALYFIEKLPTQDKEIKLSALKKHIEKTNGNIQFVNSISGDIKKVIDSETKVHIDNVNMKAFLENFMEINKSLIYISDYLNLLLETHEAKKQIKNGKGTKYTLDELLHKLQAA